MSFKRFNLSNQMLTSLNRQGYELPSPIQEKVIPKALKGANIVAQSETGSGKTHSFLIPMLEQIDFENQNVQALIISPTRELARQTFNFLNAFNIEFPLLKTKLFISGIEKDKTFRKGSLVPHIIVATPNRLQTILV
ncbi:MAG: DEAD/DEAH box helicase, partial [Erysipelotrichia bacterium]|nr:DEAD/DEAH box helicase [Erysipelotrichia bacterium]